MDSKRIMKEFARNSTAKFLLTILCVITSYSYAEKLTYLDFSKFNRGINKGSEISYAIQYQGKSTDKLSEGLKPPTDDAWEAHSTVTTSLFPVVASSPKKIVFMIRSDGREKVRSILFITIRYYDEHGVLTEEFTYKRIEVPYRWTKASFPLVPKKKAIKYAEVWFIKYQDADKTGKVNHPVYLSGVGIK